MNKLTGPVVCFLTCLFAPFAFAQTTATPRPDLVSADWSVSQAHVLNAEPKDAVWKFMLNMAGTADLPNEDNPGKVCEFHFADLRHSGELSLVVIYDGGGTADCNDVEIFDKSPAGIEKYDFEATQDFSFDSIKDLNGDGHGELVVGGGLAGGGIDHCTARWPVVYAWNGTGYSDVSTKFKGFYRQRLADLKREIAPPASTPAPERAEKWEKQGNGGVDYYVRSGGSPQAVTTPAPEAGDIDCERAEAAKIERFLGISRDAGMSDAIKWANSADPHDREFGAVILSDIGTPEAIEDLQTLSNDPDLNVARSGKDGLLAVKSPVVYPTIQANTENTGYPPAK